MSFRNRCQVAGPQGVVDLSIPLVSGREQKTLVKEVRISNRLPWAAQHWKTIMSCYSRSPWFDHYREELEGLYRRRFDYLLDWNLACFDWSVRMLGLSIPVRLTEGWVREYLPGEVMDWRGKLRPRDRESGWSCGGPDAGGMDVREGVEGMGGEAIRYRQVFEERTGFIPNLSILDLLFCEGKNARGYLRG